MTRTRSARGVLAALCFVPLVLVTGVAAAAEPAPAAKNHLRNPSAEEGVLFTPTGWETTAVGLPTIRFGWDGSAARAGKRSLYAYNTSDAVPVWHNWHQYLTDVSPFVGKDVVFRGWVKSRQLSGLAYLLVQAYSDTILVEALRHGVDRITMRERMGIRADADPQSERGWARIYLDEEMPEWTPVEVRLHVPPTTNLVIVRAGIFGIGEVWFDELALEVHPAAAEPSLPKGKNLLANPGFEEGLEDWDFSLVPMEGMRVRLASEPHGGLYAAELISSGKPPAEIVSSIFQVLNTRQLSGKRVRLSGWLRVHEMESTQAFLRLWGNGTYGDFRPPVSRAISGNSEWTHLTTEAKIPEGTVQLWAQAGFATHDGRLQVDDLVLEILE